MIPLPALLNIVGVLLEPFLSTQKKISGSLLQTPKIFGGRRPEVPQNLPKG